MTDNDTTAGHSSVFDHVRRVPIGTPDERVPGRGFIVICLACKKLARSGIGGPLPTCCGRTMETTTLNWRRRYRRLAGVGNAR